MAPALACDASVGCRTRTKKKLYKDFQLILTIIIIVRKLSTIDFVLLLSAKKKKKEMKAREFLRIPRNS